MFLICSGSMRTPQRTFMRAGFMRREPTKPEIHLWCELRAGGLAGLKFRKQHPIGPYILDFYCSAAKPAVEVDGATHATPEAISHDARRDAWVARQGIDTLRVGSGAVLAETSAVLALILETAQARMGRERRG
jgi:very-short-patch-repair endonuclease